MEARAPSVAELRVVAEHAALRVALYRRRTYLGRGEPRRLAELERIAKSAADRLRRERAERAAAYTGGLEGVGADPSGIDADGDGVGCE